jgi:hypothetical protein
MSLINSKNIKRLMLLIISLLTAMLSNIASNGKVYAFGCIKNTETLN